MRSACLNRKRRRISKDSKILFVGIMADSCRIFDRKKNNLRTHRITREGKTLTMLSKFPIKSINILKFTNPDMPIFLHF